MRSMRVLVLAFAAISFGGGAALAASDAPGAKSKKVAPPQTQAAITVACGDGKKFNISTGNSGGFCSVNTSGSTVQGGHCYGSDGSLLANVLCSSGCTQAAGSGSCASVN